MCRYFTKISFFNTMQNQIKFQMKTTALKSYNLKPLHYILNLSVCLSACLLSDYNVQLITHGSEKQI